MSQRSDIEFRMSTLKQYTKLTALERSRKLKSIEVTEGKLKSRIQMLVSEKKHLEKELANACLQQEELEKEKQKIEDTKSPVITEHALLRYVERFWKVDLERAHEEILSLPEMEVVRAKNTIVTVFPTIDDHFNLAERESI